ncbi:MAG TPA: NAD(P)-dependent oxidoreductase [Thermomicrobiaceae bacterium]|nr:NAD(P)-dependent oxidoreductase [Thermomicrobiaceae bacterium]
MSVLLTGATGFVPSNIVLALVEAGETVLALDQRPPEERLLRELATLRAGKDKVEFIQGDVCDAHLIERLIADHRPEYVVQAAAITPTREMEEAQPRQIVEVNELSLISVLESSARHGVRRVVSFSSEAAYDQREPRPEPLSEDAPLYGGDRLYSLTKIAGEALARWARAHYGLDVRIVRPGTVYGPYERPTGARQSMSGPYRAAHLALSGETLRPNAPDIVVSYVHARDVATGVLAVLRTGELAHEVYNLADEPASQRQMIEAVAREVSGTRVEWVAQPEQANIPLPDRPRTPISNQRLQADTPWRPAYTIDSGIAQYVEWLRAG